MNINFENLEKIEEIYKLLILMRDEKLNQFEKKWLTTEELSLYIGYSKETGGSAKKCLRSCGRACYIKRQDRRSY